MIVWHLGDILPFWLLDIKKDQDAKQDLRWAGYTNQPEKANYQTFSWSERDCERGAR